MNPQVLAVTALIALICGGGLLIADARTRAKIAWLRANGTETEATVAGRAMQHRKPVIVCRLADGKQITVIHRGEMQIRMGNSVRIRHGITPAGQQDAELVDEPRHSIGRGVGISLGIGIVLLGTVLAALS